MYKRQVLYGDRFVARFEPGREQDNGSLIIKNWWWESGVTPSAKMRAGLQDCFERFLSYLGTDKLQIDKALAKQKDLDWLPKSNRPSFLSDTKESGYQDD